jgi:hypothetical protein
MSRSYFKVASVAVALVQLAAMGCSRNDRSRDERPGGAIHPRAEQREHRRAIGGGPRDTEDGGTREREDLFDPRYLDPRPGIGNVPFGVDTEDEEPESSDPGTSGSSGSSSGTSPSSSPKGSGSRL